MSFTDRRVLFVHNSRWLALVLESLVVLSLLTAALPLRLAQPVWYLRLSDAAVNLAPVLLLAVILRLLSGVLIADDDDDVLLNRRRTHQLTSRWAFLFALLVPLQLVAFAWLWVDSDSQINIRISRSESQVSALRSRLMASSSEPEMRRLLANSDTGPLPALEAGTLLQNKSQITDAIAANVNRLQAALRAERSAMLSNSLPGSLRVFFGALIISSFLLLIRSQSRTSHRRDSLPKPERLLQFASHDQAPLAYTFDSGKSSP